MAGNFQDEVITRFTMDAKQWLAGLASMTEGLRKFQQAAGGINRTQNNFSATATRGMKQTSRVAVDMGTKMSNAADIMKDLSSQTGNLSTSFRRSSQSLQTSVDWLDKFSIQADRASMMMWKFTMAGVSLQKVAAVSGSLAIGFGLVTKTFITAASAISLAERQFSKLYGSAEAGMAMVEYLSSVAPKIRYSLQETIEAGRILAVNAFDPKKLIMNMADLAAGVNQQGVNIVSASRAYVYAVRGNFRRLRQTFQIDRNDAAKYAPDAFGGPNMQITNRAKAAEAILRAINDKYKGMNEATMETVVGQWSNVQDAILRSASKFGKTLEPTLIGWMKGFMGMMEGIAKFGEGSMGKTVAQFFMWGTAISAAVTALSLLGAGLVTIIGLFAAYKVFLNARGGELSEILAAELKLQKLHAQMALTEARSANDRIRELEMRLLLTKALKEEEQKRNAVLELQRSGMGPSSNEFRQAQAAQRTAVSGRKLIEEQVNKLSAPANAIALQMEIEESKKLANLKKGPITRSQDKLDTLEYRRSIGKSSEKEVEKQREKLNLLKEEAQKQRDITKELEKRLDRELASITTAERHAVAAQAYADRLNGVGVVTRPTRAQGSAASRFGGGFSGGFGAVFQPIISGLAMAFQPLIMLSQEFGKALEALVAASRYSLAGLLGSIAGVAAALATLAGLGVMLYKTLQYDNQALDSFRSSLDESVVKLKTWSQMLDMTGQEKTAMERRTESEEIRGKMGLRASEGFGMGKNWRWWQHLIPGGPAAGWATGGMPGWGQNVRFGKKLDSSTGGDEEKIKRFFVDAVAATIESGNRPAAFGDYDVGAAQNVPVDVIKKIKMTDEEYRQLLEDIDAYHQGRTKISQNQQFQLDRKAGQMAKDFQEKAIADNDTDAAGEFERIRKSANAAKDLRDYMQQTYDAAKESIPDFTTITDEFDKGVAAGKTEENILKDMQQDREDINASYDDMVKAQQVLDILDKGGAQQRKEEIEQLKKKKEMLKDVEKIYKSILALRENEKSAAFLESAGINADAVLGQETAKEAYNAAQYMQGAEKEEMLKKAYSSAMGSSKARSEMLLSDLEDRPAQNVAGRADFARRRATEIRRAAQEELSIRKQAIAEDKTLTEEQRKIAEQDMQARYNKSMRSAQQEDINASRIVSDDRITFLETSRKKLEINNGKASDMLAIEKQIFDQKMQQAMLENNTTEQYRLQVDFEATKLALIKEEIQKKEELMNLEKGLLEAAHNAGLVGESDMRRKKEQDAAYWSKVAASKKKGTPEWYDAMTKKLQAESVDFEATRIPNNASPAEKAAIMRKDAEELAKKSAELKIKQKEWLAGETTLSAEQRKKREAEVINKPNKFDEQRSDLLTQAQKLESDEVIGKLEARLSIAKALKKSDAEILAIEQQIADEKYKQSAVENNSVGMLQAQAQWLQNIVDIEDKRRSAHEQWLSSAYDYLKKLNDQGLISDQAVEQGRQAMVRFYTWMANQYPKGSTEWLQNMSKAMDLLGDQGKDKWDKIVGDILGAPQELLTNLISEGGLVSRFGQMGAALGLDKGINANIAAQNRNSLTIHVDFSQPLASIDSKLNAALPNAVNRFGQELVKAMIS